MIPNKTWPLSRPEGFAPTPSLPSPPLLSDSHVPQKWLRSEVWDKHISAIVQAAVKVHFPAMHASCVAQQSTLSGIPTAFDTQHFRARDLYASNRREEFRKN